MQAKTEPNGSHASDDLTIVVNSTDSFEDCWHPFFTLFNVYWPQCPYPIVLNTETKPYSHPALDVSVSQVGIDWSGEGRISWGDCVIRCLQSINTEYILYMQEDYFLNSAVDGVVLEEFLDVMRNHNVAHIRLMELDRSGVVHQEMFHPLLWQIKKNANYRISLQAGLWRRSALLGYLRAGESAWHFERFGTRRAYCKADLFLCQNMDEFNSKGRFVIPYKPTGIIRGKWYEAAVAKLFNEHGIVIDYSVRGFYHPSALQQFLVPVRAYFRKAIMTMLSLLSPGN